MGRPKKQSRRKKIRKIYSPAVWPTWIFVGFAWLAARLPISWIFSIGRGLGSIMYRFATSRRIITETNIAACFPQLSTEQQQQMTKRVLQQVSIGALELTIPWLNPKRDLSDRFTITGKEHFDAALAQGKGVILVGAHFAVIDIISQPLSACGPIGVMYRYNKNPVWEWLQLRGREQYFDAVIERNDTRQMLRCIRQGKAIWYAADQDYGRKHSVFAPFFGIQAATISATSRIARLNNSPVLILRQTRNNETQTWDITFSPVLENFPTDDDEVNARRMNLLLEEQIALNPDQYLWLHKRFKTRPEGEPPFYPL